MRSLLPMTAAAALLAASPTSAATITQTLPAVQDYGDFTPFDIVGSRFDPSLGTLVSVTGELTGTATPGEFRGLNAAPQTRLTTRWFVTNPGTTRFQGTFPDQIVALSPNDLGGGAYTGSPIPVDLTFDFANPSAFVGSPSPPATLVEFGFRAATPDLTGSSGGASDYTTFDGNLVLTYTYDAPGSGTPNVPEPGGLSVLGAGVLALVGRGVAAGRKRRAR